MPAHQVPQTTHQNIQRLNADVAYLKTQVKKLNQQMAAGTVREDAAIQDKQVIEQKEFLGQVAYTFSEIVKQYVFKDDPNIVNPPTMQDMQGMQGCASLTDAQKARLDAVMQKAGFPQSGKRMLQADLYLRRLCHEPAHDTWRKGKGKGAEWVTVQQLEAWASMQCQQDAVPLVKEYVQALAKFSEHGRPLNFDLSCLPDL